jgi:hypothetical protein
MNYIELPFSAAGRFAYYFNFSRCSASLLSSSSVGWYFFLLSEEDDSAPD